MKPANGYDHNYVIDSKNSKEQKLVAIAHSPITGIEMKLSTNQPGLQFYSGNSLNSDIVGKHEHIYGLRSGFALETQHFPDSPHIANFPTTLLKKGQQYSYQSVYEFSIVD